LKAFKSPGIANIEGAENNAQILRLLEGVSRQVEGIVGRWLHPKIETRYFSGNGGTCMQFPSWDIISVTTLKEDSDADAVYEVTWATTDYILGPDGNDPTDHTGPRPYWQLDVDGRSTGNQDVFLKGQRMYQLVGKFGYCDLTEASTTINEGAEFSASDTELTVAAPTNIGIGDTLVIEAEYLFVTGQLVADSNTFTVSRGANGSTAAAHADATAVSKLVYPEPIVSAVTMQASRLWVRRSAGYSNQVGFEDTGSATPQLGLDQDVRQMLDPYKRLKVS
jgi:hypothetical protein